jgi:hypothetical protein
MLEMGPYACIFFVGMFRGRLYTLSSQILAKLNIFFCRYAVYGDYSNFFQTALLVEDKQMTLNVFAEIFLKHEQKKIVHEVADQYYRLWTKKINLFFS